MCRFSIPAAPQSLRPAREQLRDWLQGLGWPVEPAEDLVYAVSEALTNAVEHAYPSATAPAPATSFAVGSSGPDSSLAVAAPSDVSPAWIKVRAVLDHDRGVDHADGGSRRVRVEVRDFGRWRPRLTDLTDPGRSRGRGIPLMQMLTDELAIEHDDDGTCVTLSSGPVASTAPLAPTMCPS